jgi:hypothetical protein
MDKWHNYFSVTAGASATLTGLIFVGVSINLSKILLYRQLPRRALGTLVLLTNILLVSSLCIIPDQSIFALGVKISTLILIVWGFNTRIDILNLCEKDRTYLFENIQNLVFNQMAISPFIVASVYLLNSNSAGISWLVPGIVMSFIKAVVDAWVLLIEIKR